MPRWIHTRTPDDIAHDAARLFKEAYGYEPKGVWGAPGRVNVIGDHVDYADGVSIPFALEQLTAVAMASNKAGTYNLVSVAPDGKKMEASVAVFGPLAGSSASPFL